MTTSQNRTLLANPEKQEEISGRALGYVSQVAKDSVYDLIIRAYIESGISKATLAKRLGKDPAQITRLLSSSGNWTVETCSELLYAINGAFLKVSECWPEKLATGNEKYSPMNLIGRNLALKIVSMKIESSSAPDNSLDYALSHMPSSSKIVEVKWQ